MSKLKWIRADEELPTPFKPVLVARVCEKDAPLYVEQGMYTRDGNWKVYGTRTKSVRYWMPMPLPPREEL